MAVGSNYHEYPTNYDGTNVSSVYDFFVDYPSYISEGLTATVIPIFLWVSLFAILSPFGITSAFGAASFISAILTGYLAFNGDVNFAFPIAFAVMTAVAAIVSMNTKE